MMDDIRAGFERVMGGPPYNLDLEIFDQYGGDEYNSEYTSRAWEAWQAATEAARVGYVVPDECPHMIVFDDHDASPFIFSGAGARKAALKKYEMVSVSWNAHLFVRIDSNCRNDKTPSAVVYPHPPAPVVPDEWREMVKELAEDLEGEIESRRSGELDRRIESDLRIVREARAMLNAAPSPAPVVPDEIKSSDAHRFIIGYSGMEALRFAQGWNACRAAMLNATPEPPAPVVPECPYHCGWHALHSIAVKRAAYFARVTIDDDYPEAVRSAGIELGEYAVSLTRAMLNAAPESDQ